MTHQQRARRSRSRLDRNANDMSRLTPEESALAAGVRAGDAAVARFDASGVLMLFTDGRHRQLSGRRLDVLRAYAELRRALIPRGHHIPATSLFAAGYTAAEVAQFDAAIAAIPVRARSMNRMET